LQGLAWPGPGKQTLTVRLNEVAPEVALVSFFLLQGYHVIAGGSVQPTAAFTNYDLVLTPAQIALITDYTKLQVLVVTSGIGGSGSGSGSGLPGQVMVSCCPGVGLPTILYASFTGAVTGTYAITWNGAGWSTPNPGGPEVRNGVTSPLILLCTPNGWNLSLSSTNRGCGAAGFASLATCSPLSLTFNLTGGEIPGNCCAGEAFMITIQVTVTL